MSNLADTLAHADTYGWQHTETGTSIETYAGRIDGLTRLEISNRTHLIFAWFGPGYFHSAELYHAGEFEPYLSCTDDGHLALWIQCHADTLQAAS